MGRASRDKGKRGEREVVNLAAEVGFEEACRNLDQAREGGDKNDALGIAGVHVQVKRCERVELPKWLAQVAEECPPDQEWAVAHRRNGEAWLATLPLRRYFELLHIESKSKGDT